jgi:hypothetical protein
MRCKGVEAWLNLNTREASPTPWGWGRTYLGISWERPTRAHHKSHEDRRMSNIYGDAEVRKQQHGDTASSSDETEFESARFVQERETTSGSHTRPHNQSRGSGGLGVLRGQAPAAMREHIACVRVCGVRGHMWAWVSALCMCV